MNITVTGRHTDVSKGLRDYAQRKIGKLERHFDQLIDAHIIFSVEKLDHIAEVVMNGDGVRFHGKERAADFHSAVDLLLEKMEAQIRRYKEKHQMHKGPDKSAIHAEQITDQDSKKIVLREVSGKPLERLEAYLQLKVSGRDFLLYRVGGEQIDANAVSTDKGHAVLFREDGELCLVEFHGLSSQGGHCVSYDVAVRSDSPSNPDIAFNKRDAMAIKQLTLHEAVVEIDAMQRPFLPFYNTESQTINVIYCEGDVYQVMVPS